MFTKIILNMLTKKTTERLVSEMQSIMSNEETVDGRVKGTIDREKQESFTMDLFKNQADQAKRSALEEYAKNLNSWMESASSRARLVIVEAKPENLDQIAKLTIDASPLERVVIVGLDEELRNVLIEKIRPLWDEKLRSSPLFQEQFQKRFNAEGTIDEWPTLLQNCSLETLLGPHLYMENIDIQFDNMSEKFPQFDTNVEEVLCYGDSLGLVDNLGSLGQGIGSGVPIFSVKSTPIEASDIGLWKCSCKNEQVFLEGITSGKSAPELIGDKTDEGYQNITLCPTYQDIFELDSLKEVMQQEGLYTEDMEQEDLDYFKQILFDEALYPANTSPEAITKTISKATSKLGALKATEVSKSLWWNLVNRPVSTAVEVEFAVGNMTLDGGNDLIKENLDKKTSYKQLFENLLVLNIERGYDPNLAKRTAMAQAIHTYCDVEKKNSTIKELVSGKTGAEAWRDFGLSETNKVQSSNEKGISLLKPSMPLFFTGVGTSLTGLTLLSLSAVPALGLGLAIVGTIGSVASSGLTGGSMFYQIKANKTYLTRANSALAQANSKMFDAQREREKQIAKKVAAFENGSLSEGEENRQTQQLSEGILSQEGITEDTSRPLHSLQEELPSAHEIGSEVEPISATSAVEHIDWDAHSKSFSVNLDNQELESSRYLTGLTKDGPSTIMDFGSNPAVDQDYVAIDIPEETNEYEADIATKETFLEILDYIDQENDVELDGTVTGHIDREKQIEYTMDLFLGQAKRSKASRLEEYAKNIDSWIESASSRARLVIVEAKQENLDTLAQIVFQASPLERVIIVGLDENLQRVFMEKLKPFWEEQLASSPELALQFQKRFNERGDTEDWKILLNNCNLKDLLGPHLSMETLDISFDSLSEKFPQFDTSVEEILCFGESPDLAGNLGALGQDIGTGTPVFSVKSSASSETDMSSWKCSSLNEQAFLSEITSGKSAMELIGQKTDQGYENINISNAYGEMFKLDGFQRKLENWGMNFPANIVQEDLDFFKKILFEEALYPADTSPVAITKTISKATSKLGALAGSKVADSLLWNLVQRPVSTSVEVAFAIGSMTLDGGNDLVKEELDKKNTYKQLFEKLRENLVTEYECNAIDATQIAFAHTVDIYRKNEKENVTIQRLVSGEGGAEEWRNLGLEASNTTKSITTRGVKNLRPMMPLYLAGMGVGLAGFGFSNTPALALSATGIAGTGVATAFLARSTQHLVQANKQQLPIANFAFAQANAKMFSAQRERVAETERQYVAIKESLAIDGPQQCVAVSQTENLVQITEIVTELDVVATDRRINEDLAPDNNEFAGLSGSTELADQANQARETLKRDSSAGSSPQNIKRPKI